MSPGGAATPWLDSGPQAVVASFLFVHMVRTYSPLPQKFIILACRLRFNSSFQVYIFEFCLAFDQYELQQV